MLKVYLFGNKDNASDNKAFETADKVRQDIKQLIFVGIKPNQDLPFDNGEDVIIMDVVEGIGRERLFTQGDLDNIILPPRYGVHDFDLGFQLKYLQKLKKLGKIKLIGLPKNKKVNYKRVISIFKKLVAQDMQGS